MRKRTLIRALLSLGLIAYLAVMMSFVNANSRKVPCKGVEITVVDSTNCQFVTSDAVRAELQHYISNLPGRPVSNVNTDSIERLLDRVNDIEEATVTSQPDGTISIAVVPMRPVARVFDPNGKSYYINRAGKQMNASLRYRLDVPVIVDQGHRSLKPEQVLPLIDRIDSHPLYCKLITAINLAPNGDVILVPAIRGLFFNLGDLSDLDNKFSRINTICSEVLPVKGWNYYDTISVKWKGQVVATRAAAAAIPSIPLDELTDEEGDDISTILADSTAVKQTSNKLPV